MPETTTATAEVSRVPGTEVIQLSPEDIVVNEELSVRPGEDSSTDAALESLANSIKAEGQIQNAVVREIIAPDGGVEYHLVAGHRRMAAISMLNASLPASSKRQYKLNCVVLRDTDDSSSFRKAIMENLHRKNATPIQMAFNIARIRQDNDWEGGANTAKVARFLCVSPAQVTQHEKLLTLDEEIQAKIHNGELTAQQGFVLVNVKPEKRMKVLEKALALSHSNGTMAVAGAGEGQGEAGEAGVVGDEPPTEQTAKKTGKKGKITTEALAQAAREESDDDEKVTPRSRKELVNWFDMFDSPSYHDNTRRFVREFVDNFAAGTAKTDRKLKRLFDLMVVPISEEDLDVLPAQAEPPTPGSSKGGGKGKGKDKSSTS